eukprot:gene42816-56912_t
MNWQQLLQRTTADGHRIEFGLNDAAFERRPRLVGYTLTALLVLTLLAFLYVRRLLRPLDHIRQGALRFGAGEFGQPIPVRHPQRPDELGELAATINTMGQDIHQMLEAQRALLLAISHELRSPLTRARLNTELLPESDEITPQREALLRDLSEMARLISDLLESERLAGRHAALHREPTDPVALAREVVDALAPTHPGAAIELDLAAGLPALNLDRTRMRLLLRHPRVEVTLLTADSKAGRAMADVFPQFAPFSLPPLVPIPSDWSAVDAELVFCALPHATTQPVIKALFAARPEMKVVDLSADFRLADSAAYAKWYGHEHQALDLQTEAVYGLTEVYRKAVRKARLVANPGCYTTCAQLAVLPLLRARAIDPESIVIDAKSG